MVLSVSSGWRRKETEEPAIPPAAAAYSPRISRGTSKLRRRRGGRGRGGVSGKAAAVAGCGTMSEDRRAGVSAGGGGGAELRTPASVRPSPCPAPRHLARLSLLAPSPRSGATHVRQTAAVSPRSCEATEGRLPSRRAGSAPPTNLERIVIGAFVGTIRRQSAAGAPKAPALAWRELCAPATALSQLTVPSLQPHPYSSTGARPPARPTHCATVPCLRERTVA
jgi:hypothetical protein